MGRETRSGIVKFTHQAARYNSNRDVSISDLLLKVNQSNQNIMLIMLHVKITEHDLLTLLFPVAPSAVSSIQHVVVCVPCSSHVLVYLVSITGF